VISPRLSSIGIGDASSAGSGFGSFARERVIDRRRRVVRFSAGSVSAYVRWAANEHGTIASRIDILRAAPPCDPISTVPGVAPGGEILLRLASWPKIQRVLEALGIDPKDAAPDHWSHIHNRISVGENPRAYSRARHRAWLLRCKVEG